MTGKTLTGVLVVSIKYIISCGEEIEWELKRVEGEHSSSGLWQWRCGGYKGDGEGDMGSTMPAGCDADCYLNPENALVIANILFQQHRRQLCTWTLPDGHVEIKLITFLQLKMEKLYTVSKNKTRSWLWLGSSVSYCKIQT